MIIHLQAASQARKIRELERELENMRKRLEKVKVQKSKKATKLQVDTQRIEVRLVGFMLNTFSSQVVYNSSVRKIGISVTYEYWIVWILWLTPNFNSSSCCDTLLIGTRAYL